MGPHHYLVAVLDSGLISVYRGVMKRTNVHLTDNQIKGLKALSKITGLNVAEHIRRAIDGYLKREKK